MVASKSCDRTGIVAIACARHGFYCPNSMADLFKGEQQKNVDFAFLQALKTTGVAVQQKVTLIYDIACQYSVHLQERIGQHLSAGLIVDMAIGLFHVHAHKDECFFRFALTFIPGIGIVCSEILESLWLALNNILSTVRMALLSHQAEMLDDHASDSNHKKLLGMALAICKSHTDASAMATQTKQYFNDMTMSAGLAAQQWESTISKAEKWRPTNISAMDIYSTKTCTDQADRPMPSSDRALNPVKKWIEYALMVEVKQYVTPMHHDFSHHKLFH